MFNTLWEWQKTYWRELLDTPLYRLPVAPFDATGRAAVRIASDYVITPPVPTTPQGSVRPAAPRSRAELTSGTWTPDDAIEQAQRRAVEEIIRENQARATGVYEVIAGPPPGPEEDNTLNYVLAAVAVTGISIAILSRR